MMRGYAAQPSPTSTPSKISETSSSSGGWRGEGPHRQADQNLFREAFARAAEVQLGQLCKTPLGRSPTFTLHRNRSIVTQSSRLLA